MRHLACSPSSKFGLHRKTRKMSVLFFFLSFFFLKTLFKVQVTAPVATTPPAVAVPPAVAAVAALSQPVVPVRAVEPAHRCRCSNEGKNVVEEVELVTTGFKDEAGLEPVTAHVIKSRVQRHVPGAVHYNEEGFVWPPPVEEAVFALASIPVAPPMPVAKPCKDIADGMFHPRVFFFFFFLFEPV
jgi:hypothetical protein